MKILKLTIQIKALIDDKRFTVKSLHAQHKFIAMVV